MEQDNSGIVPLDCSVVYYIKQLSPSDAASSKQIKLPKTEARRFCGELRHKQRSIVSVLDHQQVFWEFLCTCYGCQYALSRVAVFCNTYQLRAGQYLMFYRDTLRRLRIAVTDAIPPRVAQLISSSYCGKSSTASSSCSLKHPLVPVIQPPALAGDAAEHKDMTSPAAAAAAVSGTRRVQQYNLAGTAAAEHVDAISHSVRDQGCSDATSGRLSPLEGQQQHRQQQLLPSSGRVVLRAGLNLYHQQQQHQGNVSSSWFSQQLQKQQAAGDASAAAAAQPAPAVDPPCDHSSQNSSDSSITRQLLPALCPDSSAAAACHLTSSTSLTPTSNSIAEALVHTSPWQQQDRTAAAAPGRWSAVSASAVTAPVTSGTQAAVVMRPATATAGAVNKATYSPGSYLVCHEHLLESPPAVAATKLLLQARDSQHSRNSNSSSSSRSDSSERLKRKWEAANSSKAEGDAVMAGLILPSHIAGRSSHSGSSSCTAAVMPGRQSATPVLPGWRSGNCQPKRATDGNTTCASSTTAPATWQDTGTLFQSWRPDTFQVSSSTTGMRPGWKPVESQVSSSTPDMRPGWKPVESQVSSSTTSMRPGWQPVESQVGHSNAGAMPGWRQYDCQVSSNATGVLPGWKTGHSQVIHSTVDVLPHNRPGTVKVSGGTADGLPGWRHARVQIGGIAADVLPNCSHLKVQVSEGTVHAAPGWRPNKGQVSNMADALPCWKPDRVHISSSTTDVLPPVASLNLTTSVGREGHFSGDAIVVSDMSVSKRRKVTPCAAAAVASNRTCLPMPTSNDVFQTSAAVSAGGTTKGHTCGSPFNSTTGSVARSFWTAYAAYQQQLPYVEAAAADAINNIEIEQGGSNLLLNSSYTRTSSSSGSVPGPGQLLPLFQPQPKADDSSGTTVLHSSTKGWSHARSSPAQHEQQQQQVLLGSDEWSAVSGLLLLAHCNI